MRAPLVAAQVGGGELALVRRGAGPPADAGVVVVRARIDHAVRRVVVRQEEVRRVAAESELQHPHARQLEALAQRGHVGRDQAQVLGDDRHPPQARPHRLEQRRARALAPVAVDRGRFGGRDLPVARKAAEVVDADEIHQLEDAAQPAQPPAEAVGGMGLPAVQRVAPALAGGAEVVGRHAGDGDRPAVAVELEQGLVRPDVGAVATDEDRRVAEQAHAALVRVTAQRRPLAVEAPLAEAPERHALGVLGLRPRQRRRFAAHQRARPRRPLGPVVGLAQRHEEREVLEPAGVGGNEGVVVGARLAVGRVEEARRSRLQPAHAPGHGRGEVDPVVGHGDVRGERRLGEPATRVQRVQVDQQRVAGESRRARIGAVAGADQPERQHLPPGLPGAHQPVDEAIGLGAEVAAAMRAGQ